ncbi:hypothetical protein LLEC1_02760 [Akanthomyces lecanii]|uniref:Sugar phosphate transporter domain-containing protein n=1 Tax=Cordyceps confragosa TaxID=2714763 RepID=A0A179IT55_CORDF|nr:hypothetical protein LLEC1_02760 [Akanthomyces lecanii]
MTRAAGDARVLPIADKSSASGSNSGIHPSLFILNAAAHDRRTAFTSSILTAIVSSYRNWMFFSTTTIFFQQVAARHRRLSYVHRVLFETPRANSFTGYLPTNAHTAIILTSWHLVFATAATQILARTTTLLDSRKALPINGRMYLRTIVPIGVLYTGFLVFCNLVYLYLSVAFIQMLKSASPVAVLFTSWAFGVTEPNRGKLLNILVIVIGITIASFGEINFSMIGFVYQVLGTVFEPVRLIMIQIGKTSGLVLTLTGNLKAILIVAVSAVIWKTRISTLLALGYGIALLGLSYYSLGYDNCAKIFNSTSSYLSATMNSYSAVRGSPDDVFNRQYIVLGGTVLGFLLILTILVLNLSPDGLPPAPFGTH